MDIQQIGLLGILGIGLFSVVSILGKMQKGFGPYNLRAIILPLIITCASVLTILDPELRSATMGLLGAIAGYVFGKNDEKKGSGKSKEQA